MDSMRAVQHDATYVAQFNDDGASLITEIGRAVSIELQQHNAVVCIATGTHRRLLEKQLAARGIDILGVLSRQQYVSLNALETLSKIIVEGVLDVVRFGDVVATLIDRTAVRYPRVLIFGELVALMCADGQNAAAIELENLWRPFMAARPLFRRREYPAHALPSHSSLTFTHRTSGPRTRVVSVETNVGATVDPPGVKYLSGSFIA